MPESLLSRWFRLIRPQDFVWVLLFLILAGTSEFLDSLAMVPLAALGLVQLLEPKIPALATRSGRIGCIVLKLVLGYLVIGYTGAIEILREVGKMDPSLPEMESLLQTAVSGQEQERRRKLIEQIEAEIEKCLGTENFDRATELIERAVEQLPNEASLLQLKARVALQTRSWRVRHLIDTTAAKAQEIFHRAPGEALLIVQKALQELPGEERLLALENIQEANVELVWDPPWHQSMISEAGRKTLGLDSP